MALLHSLPLLLFVYTCAADPLGQFCNKNISSKSQISANIDFVLAELVTVAAKARYLSFIYNAGPDTVYGLAQCRGDVSNEDCENCVEDAGKQIRKRCVNQVDARLWYDYCFLRYSNENFIGKVDTSFGIYYYNVQNVSDHESFNKELGALMRKITSEAIVPKNHGLGKGKTIISPFETLYALVQCTRDLPQIDCAQCLAIAVGNFPNFCHNRKGCRVLYSSCYVRYELYPFFFPLDSNNTFTDNSIMAVVYP